jgi:hypothetical protein
MLHQKSSLFLEKPDVPKYPHRAHADIKIGKSDPKQREPREHHVSRIQFADKSVERESRCVL